MTKGTHLLRSALLALLALAVISGASFAGGDLFDSSYEDCPTKTRLRDGQISNLTVARDSDDEDHVNVSWAATDPSTWGLGPNAFDTTLVVLLDDGDINKASESLGTMKTTFEDIETGKVVKVQMAIVVNHADGAYLISDILETTINQSLTEPSFASAWNQITGITLPSPTGKAGDVAYVSTKLPGMMYYVGYNENFANYKSSDSTLPTNPSTGRLRIGLAHSDKEDDDARDTVDFDAYIIRIVGDDGDPVNEGDDVATMPSTYKDDTGTTSVTVDHDADTNTDELTIPTPAKLFLYGQTEDPTFNTGSSNKGTIGTGNYALTNVRISDDGDITDAAHASSAIGTARDGLSPNYLSMVKVDSYALDDNQLTDATSSGTPPVITPASYSFPTSNLAGTVFAEPPNEHRDFPIDTFVTDDTYTITAWAVNEDDEVISPVATLTVRPRNVARGTAEIQDYKLTTAANVTGVTTTEFTVLK